MVFDFNLFLMLMPLEEIRNLKKIIGIGILSQNGQFSARDIILTKLSEPSVSVIGQLPTIKSTSRTIQRTRITNENLSTSSLRVRALTVGRVCGVCRSGYTSSVLLIVILLFV